MNPEPYIMERTFNAPVEEVWSAISDRDEMKKWYFDLKEFKPQPGFEFQFEGGTETCMYLHLCKITDAIPNKKLAYSWRYDGYKGNSIVTFELFGEGNKTRLRLTHEGLESFIPNNNPDFDKKNFEEGWNQIIGTSLPGYLEK